MAFFENIKIAFMSIAANKMRSLLTMLGIIIGISAVITITTIGSSIEATLKNTINDLGGVNDINIMVDVRDDIDEEEYENIPEMTDDDRVSDSMIQELQQRYPGWYSTVKNEMLGNATMENYNGHEMNTIVMGASDGYLASYKIKFLVGRDISETDLINKSNVCVVSDVFARNYFPKDTDPLRQTINMTLETGEEIDFTVVGVFKNDARVMGPADPTQKEIDQLTLIAVPYDTAVKIKGVGEKYHEYTYVKWNTDYPKEQAQKQVQDFLDEKYRSNPYYQARVDTQENDIFDSFTMVINIVTIAISFISAISLVVGGVGVMNIMLVSVTERTREIGVRKAIGAPNTVIRTQFVIESVILCAIGGVIGIIIGIVNGVLIGQLAIFLMHQFAAEYESLISLSIRPSVPAMILSVLFSMLTGIFFGYYPANKAAKMNTIDALRYE